MAISRRMDKKMTKHRIDAPISPRAKDLLQLLKDLARGAGGPEGKRAERTLNELADLTNLSQRQVCRCIKELVNENLIEIDKRGLRNLYIIL